jgi:two-component system, OmpR family, sensor histidine kinase KdpD
MLPFLLLSASLFMESLYRIRHSWVEKSSTITMNSEIETKAPTERILVIMEPHAEVARLLRVAKRKAAKQGLQWEVALIECASHHQLNKFERESVLGALTLAEQMGALTTRWQADSQLSGIQEMLDTYQARGIAIAAIIAAHTPKESRWPRLRRSLPEKLNRGLGHRIPVTAVALSAEGYYGNYWRKLPKGRLEDVLIALFSVLLATCMIELLHLAFPEAIGSHNRNKAIVYMIACAFCATRHGLLAGITAAITSYFTLNLFYIAPQYSLLIDDVADMVNAGLFLTGGIMLSMIGGHWYDARQMLSRRAERFHSLLKIHRVALNKNTAAEAIAALDAELSVLLGTEIVFYLPSLMDESQLGSAVARDISLTEPEQKALQICWEESKTTGVGAPYRPEDCQWRFEPLTTVDDEIGVLGIRVTDTMVMDTDFGRLLSGIADQVALILERLQLGQTAETNKIQAEREKLRSMLLSSVSHDLKTPLASIIGSLSVFRSMGERLPEVQRNTLISTALDEAQRLDSFISNILDMTRIESGQIELREEWVEPGSLVSDVRKRLRDRLRNNTVTIYAPDAPIEVALDPVLTAQVLQNLLDNAAKYTAPGTAVEIRWSAGNSGFALEVRDHGRGIPSDQLEKVFDKYARINKQDHQIAGTGLGLAIARAVMQAQGGKIFAANHPEGGAVFTIILPKTRIPDDRKAA